jgi:hypothetical protein
MAVTINTGTTAPTTVLIQGDDVAANTSVVYIWEQVVTESPPTPGNSILLGSTLATPNGGGSFTGDRNSDDFAMTIVLDGLTSYSLGATGVAGDIFLSITTAILYRSAPVPARSTPIIWRLPKTAGLSG